MLSLIAAKLNLSGPVWRLVGALNDNFGSLGYLIITIFIANCDPRPCSSLK